MTKDDLIEELESCVRMLKRNTADNSDLLRAENTLRAWRGADELTPCENCNGEGGHEFYHDPSPRGVGLPPGTMRDFIECSRCGGMGVEE